MFIRKSLFPAVVGESMLLVPQAAWHRAFHLPLASLNRQQRKGEHGCRGWQASLRLSYHPWSPWKGSVHLEVSMKMEEELWKSQRQGREPSRVQRSLEQSYTSISTR